MQTVEQECSYLILCNYLFLFSFPSMLTWHTFTLWLFALPNCLHKKKKKKVIWTTVQMCRDKI